MPSSPLFRLFFLLLSLSLALAPRSSSFSDLHVPSSATKISIPGIHNAGRINDRLFRGSQPSLTEISELRKLGVTTVIDLRAESPDTANKERNLVEALGMKFQRIPIGGFATPSNADLLHFFRILRDTPSQTVFVHCEFGQDRTGVMIAVYRIAFENWTPEQALAEMMEFGFNHLWHPSMIRFVRNLPQRLQSDPELKKALQAP